MFKSDNGDIELCNENFPNVTTIKKLVFDSDPFYISRFLPNLKNVDDRRQIASDTSREIISEVVEKVKLIKEIK